MQAGDVPLKEIRRVYGRLFPKTNPHHVIPGSRNGPSSHFNLFPYKRSAHCAYHSLFWNIRIDELWRDLNKIYESIFESDDESIYPWWLMSCELDSGTGEQKNKFQEEKNTRLKRPVRTIKLQELWFRAFGGSSLGQARNLLKYMMLFMVFGINMVDVETLFDNGNLIEFFEGYPSNGYRVWAFEICFGKNGAHAHGIKSKTSKIIRKIEATCP